MSGSNQNEYTQNENPTPFRAQLGFRPGSERARVPVVFYSLDGAVLVLREKDKAGKVKEGVDPRYARILLILARLRDEGQAELPQTRGWIAYDELERRIERETDWALEPGVLVSMLSQLMRKIRRRAAEAGVSFPDIIERDHGAARISPLFDVQYDERVARVLLPTSFTVPQHIVAWAEKTGIDPLVLNHWWPALVDALREEVFLRSGPLYAAIKDSFEAVHC